MADFDQNPVEYLKEKLETRVAQKQKLWTITQEFFDELKQETVEVSNLLDREVENPSVQFEVMASSVYEFTMKFGSDVLVFGLNTNIVTFNENNYLMKQKKVKQNPALGYFGQVRIYNFMADSVKYERVGDAGYLIARLLVDLEKNFYIEGVKGLHYLFPPGGTASAPENLSLLIKKAIAVTIESDLIGDDFGQIQQITWGQKLLRDKEIGLNSKIGFQMSHQDEIRG